MKNLLPFFAPDATGTSATVTSPSRGPFDKAKMAALVEADEIASNAANAPYAGVLNLKYQITPAQISALQSDITECQRLFGASRSGRLGSQTSTVNKDAAREAIIEAIDEFRTGARLSFRTDADMEAFGVGVDLEKNSSVLAQLAQTILDDPRSPTLRGIGAEEMTALQSALTDWRTAGGDQSGGAAQSQGDHARALILFDKIEDTVRDIKVAINGRFSYRDPANVDARKLFHLPPHRPYAPRMGERA